MVLSFKWHTEMPYKHMHNRSLIFSLFLSLVSLLFVYVYRLLLHAFVVLLFIRSVFSVTFHQYFIQWSNYLTGKSRTLVKCYMVFYLTKVITFVRDTYGDAFIRWFVWFNIILLTAHFFFSIADFISLSFSIFLFRSHYLNFTFFPFLPLLTLKASNCFGF